MSPRFPVPPPPLPRRPPRVGYLIVEHPTRGTLREIEFDNFEFDANGRYRLVNGRRVPIYKARWSVSRGRDDPEGAERFYSTDAALAALAKIPARQRDQCKILMSPAARGLDWQEVPR